MKIKLFNLASDLNVGLSTIIAHLKTKDIIVENNPNVRIGDTEFELIMSKFGSQLSREERDVIINKYTTPKGQNAQSKEKKDSTQDEPKEKLVSTVEKVIVKGHVELSQDKPATQSAKANNKENNKKSAAAENKNKEEHPKAKQEKKQEPTAAKPEAVESKKASEKEVAKEAQPQKPAPAMPTKENKEPQKQEPKAVAKPEAAKEVQPQVEPAPKATPAPQAAKEPAPKVEKEPAKAAPQVKEEPAAKQTAPVTPKEAVKNEPAAAGEPVKAAEANELKDESVRSDQPAEIFRFKNPDEPKIAVVGKIDLSAINDPSKKKKGGKEVATANKGKRKRMRTSEVDIKAEVAKGINDTHAGHRKQKEGANNANNRNEQKHNTPNNNNKKQHNKRPAPVHEPIKTEVSQEDVERKVKEVRARIAAGKHQVLGKGENRKQKRDNARRAAELEAQNQLAESKIIKITEFVTVSDLANLMKVPVNEVIATCMSIDMMVSINMRLEADTIKLIAEEFGYQTEFVSADVVEAIKADDAQDKEEDLVERPPVVTVMGHVDHGKTSLLDHIRNTNVIAGEAGGITQHIGAYSVKLKSGREITFLDTPGHQAFTAMRARGAKITDIAIIIIDATSTVMPQTVEALNHASAAGVPIVFAINKIDHPNAKPEHIKEKLAQLNYLVEDWGGKYQSQEISAKTGVGVRELLDKVLLEADLLELRANPKRNAVGQIIESSLDRGRGFVAQILVSNGTLKVGDMVLAGKYYGRVKALTNERGQNIKSAGPSTPATLLGLDGAPSAGDSFNVLSNEQEARDIARRRRQLDREQDIRTQHRLTLEEIGKRIKIGNFKEMNLIIKGDVDGSIEALSDSLIKLSTDEVAVRVIHKAVGQISENDVELAKASEAVIIGFQVRPTAAARKTAEQNGVEIRTYSVIYDTIDDVKSAMEGMLSPEIKEQVTATLEVLQVFHIKGVGTIAGCMVKEGKIKRTDKVRIIRDGIVVHSGELGSLKRFKDDAKEVVAGLECGLDVSNCNDILEGDQIESYTELEIKKKL